MCGISEPTFFQQKQLKDGKSFERCKLLEKWWKKSNRIFDISFNEATTLRRSLEFKTHFEGSTLVEEDAKVWMCVCINLVEFDVLCPIVIQKLSQPAHLQWRSVSVPDCCFKLTLKTHTLRGFTYKSAHCGRCPRPARLSSPPPPLVYFYSNIGSEQTFIKGEMSKHFSYRIWKNQFLCWTKLILFAPK